MMSGYDHILSLVLGKSPVGDMAGPAVSAATAAEGDKLVLYPRRLRYREILTDTGSGDHCRYLPFSPAMGITGRNGWRTVQFLRTLWRQLDRCDRLEIFFLSPRLDWPAVFTSAVISRLKGVPSVLHDLSFRDCAADHRLKMLRSLCLSSGEAGDVGDGDGADGVVAGMEWLSAPDGESYRRMRKDKAVPHVIVVGNEGNERMTALARRAFDLVKQKYPRTEFFMATVTENGVMVDGEIGGGLSRRVIAGEQEMKSLFAESDVVAFLSPGGINGLFAARAQAVGFPIIVNGFDLVGSSLSPARPVVIPRDSYSALAEAVIRLVDDDVYYRSFASL